MAKKSDSGSTCEAEHRNEIKDSKAVEAAMEVIRGLGSKDFTTADLKKIERAHAVVHHDVATGNYSIAGEQGMRKLDSTMEAALKSGNFGELKSVLGDMRQFAKDNERTADTAYRACMSNEGPSRPSKGR
jgi:hypothetical protein